MWDFGTVRHTGRTIGRSSVRAAGAPLTWENDPAPPPPAKGEQIGGSRNHRASGSSGSSGSPTTTTSYSSTSTAKAERDLARQSPPVKAHGSGGRYEPSTVRHMNAVPEHSTPRASQGHGRTARREPSEEYDHYDEAYDEYPGKGVVDKVDELHLDDEDDLLEATMLDSVVLPAIASVSCYIISMSSTLMTVKPAFPPSLNSRRQSCLKRTPPSIQRCRADYSRCH